MADVNVITITGRLTKDGHINTLASGKEVLVLNVANNIGFGDFKKTCFFVVQVWGQSIRNIESLCTKGQLIGVSGKLERHEWEAKDGNKVVDLYINTSSIDFIPSGQKKTVSNSESEQSPTDEEVVF